jgi:hypothetical protein
MSAYNLIAMATFEIIPEIMNNMQFPIGDLVDTHKDKKVNEWFDSAFDMDRDRLWTTIKYNYAPTYIDGNNACLTHSEAVALCMDWDRANDNGTPYVRMGYRLAMTFNQQTRYLPKCDIDLTDDLSQMRRPEKDGGRLHSSREFGRTAWKSMELYPNVNGTFQRLVDLALQRYDLHPDEALEDFQTGMSLPFMFAWASRLHGYRGILPSWLTRPEVTEGDSGEG